MLVVVLLVLELVHLWELILKVFLLHEKKAFKFVFKNFLLLLSYANIYYDTWLCILYWYLIIANRYYRTYV